MISESDKAYMAGFVDADGSIGIVSLSQYKRFVGQVAVSNCNKEIVYMFKNYFGGKVRKRNWKNPKWKPNYEWKLTATKACDVIRLLEPYLKLKQKQATLVLALHTLKTTHNSASKRWDRALTAKLARQYKVYKTQCAKLNKRGR